MAGRIHGSNDPSGSRDGLREEAEEEAQLGSSSEAATEAG